MSIITREIQVEPTVDEVAETFCNWSSDEQAKFFEAIAEKSSHFSRNRIFQWEDISTNPNLTDRGRKLMSELGEYASKINNQ